MQTQDFCSEIIQTAEDRPEKIGEAYEPLRDQLDEATRQYLTAAGAFLDSYEAEVKTAKERMVEIEQAIKNKEAALSEVERLLQAAIIGQDTETLEAKEHEIKTLTADLVGLNERKKQISRYVPRGNAELLKKAKGAEDHLKSAKQAVSETRTKLEHIADEAIKRLEAYKKEFKWGINSSVGVPRHLEYDELFKIQYSAPEPSGEQTGQSPEQDPQCVAREVHVSHFPEREPVQKSHDTRASKREINTPSGTITVEYDEDGKEIRRYKTDGWGRAIR